MKAASGRRPTPPICPPNYLQTRKSFATRLQSSALVGWKAHTLNQDVGFVGPVAWASADEIAALQLELESVGRDIWRNPHLEQDWALDVATSAAVMALVRQTIGPDVLIENTFLVSKQPGAQFEVPAHQDGIDEYLELDPEKSISAWFALSDATTESGCLWVVPRSHRDGYLEYSSAPSAGSADGRGNPTHLVGGEGDEFVPIPANAGEAIVFSSALVHRSDSNNSSSTRWGLNVRYVAPGGIIRRHPDRPAPLPV